MSGKIYEACRYMDCTTKWKELDMENDAMPKTTTRTDEFVYMCAEGNSREEAVANLDKKIAGIPQRELDVVCKPRCEPIVREYKSLFSRIGDYLSSQQIEVCQEFSVTREVYVAYDGVHEIEVYRPEQVTKSERICARGAKLGEARIAHGKKVSDTCEGDAVSCEAKGEATLSVKESIAEKVGNFFASVGRFFNSGGHRQLY